MPLQDEKQPAPSPSRFTPENQLQALLDSSKPDWKKIPRLKKPTIEQLVGWTLGFEMDVLRAKASQQHLDIAGIERALLTAGGFEKLEAFLYEQLDYCPHGLNRAPSEYGFTLHCSHPLFELMGWVTEVEAPNGHWTEAPDYTAFLEQTAYLPLAQTVAQYHQRLELAKGHLGQDRIDKTAFATWAVKQKWEGLPEELLKMVKEKPKPEWFAKAKKFGEQILANNPDMPFKNDIAMGKFDNNGWLYGEIAKQLIKKFPKITSRDVRDAMGGVFIKPKCTGQGKKPVTTPSKHP